MRKVKRLWMARDTDGTINIFKKRPFKYMGDFSAEDLSPSIGYLLTVPGIRLRPGQKKQIEIREVK